MERQRWYITGLLGAIIIICSLMLGLRWRALAERVELSPRPGTASAEQVDEAESSSPASGQNKVAGEQGASDAPARESSATNTPAIIDINAASARDLQELPGIGPVIAQRIVEHRDEHGNFASVEALLEVRGIGEATLSEIRGKVTAGAEAD